MFEKMMFESDEWVLHKLGLVLLCSMSVHLKPKKSVQVWLPIDEQIWVRLMFKNDIWVSFDVFDKMVFDPSLKVGTTVI